MSVLVDRIDGARQSIAAGIAAVPESEPLGKKLREAVTRLDAIKQKIVATKEGGAITGEERIREHLDTAYGALLSWEGKPAAYQVERVETLRRELDDVRKEFEALDLSALTRAGGRR